ncbi:MAG: ABC transporter ATP-binding protein [Candidatus Pacebacteria bacterium]|nr:ABC transporter ATP-binding protein [Candidatus Paceibacterota bacterium]
MAYDLECRQIVKRFEKFTAVDNVSVEVPQGSFFSILGPSGCGKTSLLRMVAGFSQPDSGDILINGQSILNIVPNKRPVNMVFQHLALFPLMTVFDNIAYGLRRRGVAAGQIKTKVADILARINLPDSGSKQISQLSGGQKQRIAIARCMVMEPTVLLLDEPLGALDLKLREHMKLELKQLQQQFGTTFVYITHDQSEALVLSDRVAVMNNGRFEQVAAPQELYYRPATAFVAGFVGDNHRWQGKVARVAGDGLEIATASGQVLRVTAANAVKFSSGDQVQVFVRPEAIDIVAAGKAAQGENQLDGVLETLLFNGANSRAMVKAAGEGELIEVALPQTAHYDWLKQGVPVRLGFSGAAALAFAG